MSDILIMTLGLIAGVVGCLARPCGPEYWHYVKAAQAPLEPLASGASERELEAAPASEPGFADGLTVPA